MRKFIILCLSIVLLACGRNPAIKSDYDNIIDNEIANRFEILAEMQNDSTPSNIKMMFADIKTEVNNLILLSKDIENSEAVIEKANLYFVETTKKHTIPYEGFVVIMKTMSLQTIETTLKTNELNLLDKILFNYTKMRNDSTAMGSVY